MRRSRPPVRQYDAGPGEHSAGFREPISGPDPVSPGGAGKDQVARTRVLSVRLHIVTEADAVSERLQAAVRAALVPRGSRQPSQGLVGCNPLGAQDVSVGVVWG